MAVTQVPKNTEIQQWVENTNQIGNDLGDVGILGGTVADGLNLIDTTVGSLALLDTLDQTDLVSAINEVKRTIFIMALVLTETVD